MRNQQNPAPQTNRSHRFTKSRGLIAGTAIGAFAIIGLGTAAAITPSTLSAEATQDGQSVGPNRTTNADNATTLPRQACGYEISPSVGDAATAAAAELLGNDHEPVARQGVEMTAEFRGVQCDLAAAFGQDTVHQLLDGDASLTFETDGGVCQLRSLFGDDGFDLGDIDLGKLDFNFESDDGRFAIGLSTGGGEIGLDCSCDE